MTAATVRTGTVEASGLSLAYFEQGTGDAVVLVHGTALGHRTWEEVVAALGEELRSIAYDRRGYGESGAPEAYRGTTVAEQAEDAAGVIDELGAAPAIVCGHELGALVALDLLRRHAAMVRGTVLVEPPVLALSRSGPTVVAEMREAIETGAREAHDPGAGAVDAYLAEVAGPGVAELIGPERRAAAHAAATSFAADLAGAPTFTAGRRELRELTAPVTVLAGSRSSRVRREVAEALAGLLPNAVLGTVDSGHLIPIEAPESVADAIRGLAAR